MDPGLVEAAKTGDMDYLLRLIGEDSQKLYDLWLGETPLHIASMRGHLSFVQEVLKVRKQIAYNRNQDGFTPLHLASANGHLQIVLELLKVDPDFCTIQGWENWLPLHCAVVNGSIDVMKALLYANPDSVEMKTFRGETVFHLSVSNNQLGAFELLMEHVKKFKKEQILNEKDEKGSTILHYAVLRKQYQVIHLLVDDHVTELHVEVNSKNKLGLTPLDFLHLVMRETDRDLELLLLKAGAKRGKYVPNLDPPPSIAHQVQSESHRLQLPTIQESQSTNNNNKLIQSDSEAVLSPPGGLWRNPNPTWRGIRRHQGIIIFIAMGLLFHFLLFCALVIERIFYT